MGTARYWVLALLVLGLLGGTVVFSAVEEAPRYTIQDVMKKTMQGGLAKKVGEGKASDDEKKQLVEYWSELPKQDPPKGDHAEWKQKVTGMVAAAQEAAAGKEEGQQKLLELTKRESCTQCHGFYRNR